MWLPKYCAWGLPRCHCGVLGDAGRGAEHYDASQRGDGRGAGHGRRVLASLFADLSDDGRYVAFTSSASNLVAGDTNLVQDIFVHDRQTGSTTRVSVGAGGAQANGAERGSINQWRRKIRLVSVGGDKPRPGRHERACRLLCPRQADRCHDASQRGDRWCTGDRWAQLHHGHQREWAIRGVLLCATNLVAGDTNGVQDVFRHDRQTATTIRVSVATGGAQPRARATSGLSSAPTGDSSGSTRRLPTLFPAIPMVCPMCSSTTSRLRPRLGSVSVLAERRQR